MEVLNYQGRMINPLALKREDFDNVGMQCAVTLSRLQRFWGQCRESYTVAQHCLSMVEIFKGDKELQKWAISHEIYEALTGMDIPSPIKHSPAYEPYQKAEEEALRLFAELHDMLPPMPEVIKEADRGLLVMEAEALMPYTDKVNWRDMGTPMGVPYKLGATEAEIRRDFIAKWVELFGSL